jgi:hypothetical protein
MYTPRRPSRITETWLMHFIENPEQVLWPEVRSMARELLASRRRQYRAEIEEMLSVTPGVVRPQAG